MFDRSHFAELENMHHTLTNQLNVLEVSIKHYEEHYRDSAGYQELQKFEQDTYGKIDDFRVHTIGLIANLQDLLTQLVDFEEGASAVEKDIKTVAKQVMLEFSFPAVVSSVTANVEKYMSVLDQHEDQSDLKRDVRQAILEQLKKLTKEAELLKKYYVAQLNNPGK